MKSALVLFGATAALVLSACSDSASSGRTVSVDASESACEISTTAFEAGSVTFKVKNSGNKITEFYVYGEGEKIVGEVENIGPGLSRNLTVDLVKGTYEGACKPGQTGDGIRTKVTVSGG